MKILNPSIHGVLDYTLAGAFLLAPTLLNFSGNAALLAYVIGVLFMGASIVTRYPLGLIKLIPFPIHGVIETAMAVGFIASPWLFAFSGELLARNFFVVSGASVLVIVALTDYKRVDLHAPIHRAA